MANVNHVDQNHTQDLDLNQTQRINAVVDQMKDSKADARTQVQMAMQKNNVADIGLELVRRSAQGMAQSGMLPKAFSKKAENDMDTVLSTMKKNRTEYEKLISEVKSFIGLG